MAKDSDDEDHKPEMSANERIIRAFAAQFDPPLPICGTKQFATPAGLIKVKSDAWQTAYCTPDQSFGVSCVIYGAQKIYAFLEANGETDEKDAIEVARAFAVALKLNGGSNGRR